VFGILKRNGYVYTQVIKNATKSKHLPIIKEFVKTGGTVYDVSLETPIVIQKRRIKDGETWFDFIVETRFIFDFTENLLLSVKSDIGKFGLGFYSDIDWNFVTNVGYQLPWWGVTPYVGYRVFNKYGSGYNRFVYKIWNTGPQVGLGIRF